MGGNYEQRPGIGCDVSGITADDEAVAALFDHQHGSWRACSMLVMLQDFIRTIFEIIAGG